MKMNRKIRTLWITQTAAFMGLLIVFQIASAPLGNVIITGSVVNLLLIVAAMTCGLASGLTVAAVSPVMAKLLGIGPLWSLIPFIAAGNVTLVLLWYFVGSRKAGNQFTSYITAMLCGAAGKFLVLYIGIVQIAIPLLLKLPEPQATVISGMFSLPQLITALTGGFLACVLIPRVKKPIERGVG